MRLHLHATTEEEPNEGAVVALRQNGSITAMPARARASEHATEDWLTSARC